MAPSPWYFAKRITPYNAHIHMGDAAGLNAEGLQVSDGEIDLVRLNRLFSAKCLQASFIPDIWQCHKNAISTFLIALDRIEGTL
jgi:hypothetical protein